MLRYFSFRSILFPTSWNLYDASIYFHFLRPTASRRRGAFLLLLAKSEYRSLAWLYIYLNLPFLLILSDGCSKEQISADGLPQRVRAIAIEDFFHSRHGPKSTDVVLLWHKSDAAQSSPSKCLPSDILGIRNSWFSFLIAEKTVTPLKDHEISLRKTLIFRSAQ